MTRDDFVFSPPNGHKMGSQWESGKKLLNADRWQETRTKGSRYQFKHSMNPDVVTVPQPERILLL